MLDQLINVLGKSINSDEMKAFFEENGIKYPKKDKRGVTAWSSSDTLFATARKLGLELSFLAEVWNPLYPLVPSDRKGVYYFRLVSILLDKKSRKLVLDHFHLTEDIGLKELLDKLGQPVKTGKDYFGGNFYYWMVCLDEVSDVHASFRFSQDKLGQLTLLVPNRPVIKSVEELFSIMGKPINSLEVKYFIEKYGGVYPMKDTISTILDVSTGRTVYDREKIEGQFFDLPIPGIPGTLLTFGLKDTTDKYKPIAAKKKDHYYPILGSLFSNNIFSGYGSVELPLGVRTDDSLEVAISKWGKPAHTDLDAKTGKELGYTWSLPILDNDFIVEISYLNYLFDQEHNKFDDALRIQINTDK